MAQQLSPDVVYHSYALLRRGQHKWDAWYDLRRVPSREGSKPPVQACQPVEILAQWDLKAPGAAVRP